MIGEFLLSMVILFIIVGLVTVLIGKFVHKDTWDYDQTYIWRRKVPEEVKRFAKNEEKEDSVD